MRRSFDGVRRLFHVGRGEPSLQDAVDAELRFHLEARIDELMTAGAGREEAERTARREFGDLDSARRELAALDRRSARQGRWAALFHDLASDGRFAIRLYRRNPAFTATLLLTFAIGIGATTGVFSVVRAVLLDALPYREPSQLVAVEESVALSQGGRSEASWPDFQDWRAASSAFAGLEGFEPANRTVLLPEGPAEIVRAARVTSGFLDLLGVRPLEGRLFLPGEDGPGGTPVALLSHGYWQRAFGGAPVLGSTLQIDGEAHTIIGVLPAGFHFAGVGAADLWLPLARSAQTRSERFNHWLRVVGRLRPGTTIEQGRADLAAVMQRLEREYPETNEGRGIIVEPLREMLTGSLRPILRVLAGAVVLLLILTCANVAGLLLARAQARSREMQVRLALGSGRGRLARQLLTESLLIAVLGALLGLPIAEGSVQLLLSQLPDGLLGETPSLAQVRLDRGMLAFTAGIALLAGLAFGAAPAVLAARTGQLPESGRQSATRRAARLRGVLVASEIAVALVLVAGTTLVGRSLGRLLSREAGFDADRVLTFRLPLSGSAYLAAGAQQRFWEELLGRLDALPDVSASGAVTNLPLNGGGTNSFHAEGLPEAPPSERPEAVMRGVAGDYFRAMDIQLVAGRGFSATDDSAAPRVIVVSAALARRVFGEPAGAIGRRLRFYAFPQDGYEVVGVTGDVMTGRLDEPPPVTVYYPHLQSAENRMTVTLRTNGDPLALAQRAIETVRGMDPRLPVYQIRTMAQAVEDSPAVFARRYPLLLLAAFAGIALMLALIGVYGVVAYSVARRWRELGIRIALGATRSSILLLVLREGAALAASGTIAGLLLSLAAGRFLGAVLFEIAPFDLVTHGMVAAVLTGAALLATLLPARRAAATNPAITLRAD